MKSIRIPFSALPPALLAPARILILLFAALCLGSIVQAQRQELDLGDAPKPYPTLINEDGARHVPLKGFSLGKLIDVEGDGQPSSTATGDDSSPAGAPSDEDGVVFDTHPLLPGQAANLTVFLSAGDGRLDAWIDWNADGDWDDMDEQIFRSANIGPGANLLRIVVPEDALVGQTYSRFRLSREGFLKTTGIAGDGEVEDYLVTIGGGEIDYDFGDAPAPYPTILKDDGARHRIEKGFFLGEGADREGDGQPDSDATGDDKNPATSGFKDEDGVLLITNPLLVGRLAQVELILTGQRGMVDAWVDFNQDGDWLDEGEQIFRSEVITVGANPRSFAVPSAAKSGTTFARFRLSFQGSLTPTGESFGGEVEDYMVRIDTPQEPLDFGDAPSPYPTLLVNNGPRHAVVQGFFLGRVVDIEQNGQPNADATGDDLAGSANIGDDEDGVTFKSSVLISGTTAEVEVVLNSGRGALDAWVDFNRDGDWGDAGEQIATAQILVAGLNTISFPVPASTVSGISFARFRLSQQGGLQPTGAAGAGEIEDHRVQLEKAVETFDFGDAPAPYPTLLADNGARHSPKDGFNLGAAVDREQNGQPNSNATGDDQVNAAVPRDDEDGVRFLSSALTSGSTASVEVTLSSGRGALDAWVDFNRDGDWADAGERIATATLLVTGPNTITFPVPSGTVAGVSFARFRLSSQGGLSFTGLAADGEVEDYQVTLEKAAETFDFSDAPAPYPTLLKDNGARHSLVQRFVLGQIIDLEPDGQPNATAMGDDQTVPGGPPGDEDGVKFLTTPLVASQTARIEVTLLSGTGRLDAWIDFNRDGDWADAGEQVFVSQSLVAGVNPFDIKIPDDAKAGESYSRFRLSSKGALSFTGPASDGEVEDYLVRIGSKPEPTVDLIMSKVDGPDPVNQGDTLTYSLAVSNGGQTAATGVQVTDQLPPGVTFLDALPQTGSCSINAGMVTCNLGVIPPQTTTRITIRVIPNIPGTITNTASTTCNEPETTTNNNSRTVTTTVVGRPQAPCDERTNRGTNFWLTFPGNYAPDTDNPIRLSVGIIGQRLTTGTIRIPGLGFSTNFTIPGSMEVVIPLPNAADLGDAIDLVENKGIQVIASAEVAVFGLNKVNYTTDGFLGLPIDVVGKAYLVQAFKNTQTGAPELNGTQFAIVGTEDATQVSIRPSVTTGSRVANVPYTITLHRGQTYQLRNKLDAPADLSGTMILADKPVSVFAGHQVANVATSDLFFADYMVEQLVSMERAGTRFMSMPFATRSNGDTFRLSALQNGTTILINGSPAALLNAGQTTERIISGPSLIVSDKPILVTQFSNSSDYDGQVNADPHMIVLQHQGQYLNRVPFWTPSAGFVSHYVNVIAPTAAIGSVSLDGVAIPAASFTAIPGSGFSGAQIVVTPGAHLVLANVPVGVVCYGWSEFESYGYPGGMFFGDTQPPTLNGPQSPVIVKLGNASTSACTVAIPDFRQNVQVTDNCGLPDRTIVNQDPKPGTLVGPGTYQIVLSAIDAKANIGYAIIEYQVIDESAAVLNCPQNMVVNCQTEQGANVNFRVVASSRCGQYEATSEPPSGSFFPIGVTTVTSTYTDPSGVSQTCSFTITVQCSPTLTITHQNNRVQLDWGGDQILQSARDVTGPWTTVINARPPFNVTPAGDRAYYRIVPRQQ